MPGSRASGRRSRTSTSASSKALGSFELDRNPNLKVWVKNDHLGFEILYVFRGVVRKYRPDYLVCLENGRRLVLEVKGQDSQQDQTKREFLDEWVRAVNQHGGFGTWSWDVSRHPKDVAGLLEKNSAGLDPLGAARGLRLPSSQPPVAN